MITIDNIINTYCQGQGIDVGVGNMAYCPRDRTKYIDKYVDGHSGCKDPDIVADASNIPIPDSDVDFVFSSHCLEHLPNALRALKEWLRVLKVGGILCLILPSYMIIDSKREITTLDHILKDYETLDPKADFDSSHFSEMREGWQLANILVGKDIVSDADRISNSMIHYHCWTQNEIVDIFRYLKIDILFVCDDLQERKGSFVVVGRKTL